MRDFLYKGYLAEGEEIIFVIRRHFAIEAVIFLKLGFFGIFLPLFAWWLFPQITLFAAVWLGIGGIRFLYEILDWYYDVWLVTNQSIVEIFWQGFFQKMSQRIEYHIIQGIGYEVNGVLPTLLNYGNIQLDKFTGNPSVFKNAWKPKRNADMLTKAQDDFVSKKSFRDHRALQGILSDMLQQHVVQHGIPSIDFEDE
ncbi:hypothetical protein COV82_01700 [Candidatus Peregrinibacteria bacterium CG11_big_fil_rev_8_21_14_0_20_46_8]|nr:MAG: hypothetical protein COV82_01700 [Candidatus Peregrinibacteria bacterium CG11_big_fil_rev_8_21_14_0_20_46_8]